MHHVVALLYRNVVQLLNLGPGKDFDFHNRWSKEASAPMHLWPHRPQQRNWPESNKSVPILKRELLEEQGEKAYSSFFLVLPFYNQTNKARSNHTLLFLSHNAYLKEVFTGLHMANSATMMPEMNKRTTHWKQKRTLPMVRKVHEEQKTKCPSFGLSLQSAMRYASVG